MKTGLLVIAVIVAASLSAHSQASPAPAKSIPDSVNYMWKEIEQEFTSLADGMPPEKWGFKPTNGEFAGVRTFGEQVKHVACANEAWAKKLQHEQPPGRCDTGGPNPAKTKAEIMQYLRESFRMVDAQITATNAANLMEPLHGPYAGDNRLEVLTAVIWHASDHYGQLVEYLRMNGIVPPASRPQGK